MKYTSRSAITVGAQHVQGPTYPMLQQRFDCPLYRTKTAVQNAVFRYYPAIEIAPPYLTF